MAELDPRWGSLLLTSEIEQAVAESPDGLVHAGLSTDRLALCERMDDTWLGESEFYVRLNLDLPGASAEKQHVTCLGCKEAMHS